MERQYGERIMSEVKTVSKVAKDKKLYTQKEMDSIKGALYGIIVAVGLLALMVGFFSGLIRGTKDMERQAVKHHAAEWIYDKEYRGPCFVWKGILYEQ